MECSPLNISTAADDVKVNADPESPLTPSVRAEGRGSRRRAIAALFAVLGLLACLVLAALSAAYEQEEGSVGESTAALPRRASEAETSVCRDPQVGEPCHRHVTWAMATGIEQHAEWYPGLNKDSTFQEFQAALHRDRFADCPRPCAALPETAPELDVPGEMINETEPGKIVPEDIVIGWEPMGAIFAEGRWCSAQAPSSDWRLDYPTAGVPATGLRVKVLTYNLFWWNLFGRRGGNGGSAGRLIAQGNQGEPYDIMGFQECEDVQRVLRDGGLQDQFEGVPGPHAMAIAYRKDAWDMVAGSDQDVAEDRPDQWYGTRAGQWIRLRNRASGMNLFFVVHHGPLPVDSGGLCGGEATAFNIMKLIGSSAAPGDAIVVVGDFNAGETTGVVSTLQERLHKVYTGKAFGGVDHIFSSCSPTSVVEKRNLGSGGSDHDAVDALLQF